MNIQRAATADERQFHLCPQSVIRLKEVSKATCLAPPSVPQPLVVARGHLVFLKCLVRAFGGASYFSWQVTFKMCCRGLQPTAWRQAWQAIDWKLAPGQLLIAVRNNPQPRPTICCLSTEGTVQGSTLRSTRRACHSASLTDEEDNGEWSNRDRPQSPQLLVY